MRILPLTISAETDMSFVEFMRLVESEFSSAFSHQQYPYAKAFDFLKGSSNSVLNTSIQTYFNYKEGYVQALRIDGLNVQDLNILTKRAKCDLSFFVERPHFDTHIGEVMTGIFFLLKTLNHLRKGGSILSDNA
jgi:hypothetical protein